MAAGSDRRAAPALVVLCAAAVSVASLPRPAAMAARPEQAPSGSTLTVTAVDGPPFPLDQTHPRQLSGLTWAGEDRFYAVSDNESSLFPYRIAIDPATGRIVSATLDTPVPITDANGQPWRGGDLEGLAFDGRTGDVWVADEGQSADPVRAIRRHRVRDGRFLSVAPAGPPAFGPRNIRDNLGLESLSISGAALWTSNEDALVGDGPRSTTQRGGTVRLTRVQADGAVAQWAYQVEPSAGALPTGGGALSGVVDLAALDDGRVLVLERATAGSRGPMDIGGFVIRVCLADVSGATDITSIDRLSDLEAGRDYVPAARTALWTRYFSLFGGPNNFEGMALGPALADGSRSLLLVADNDVLPSNLLALAVR